MTIRKVIASLLLACLGRRLTLFGGFLFAPN